MKKRYLIAFAVVITANSFFATAASAQKIAGGLFYSLSICLDSAVKAWGYNYYGQLGEGDTINKTIPVDVYGLAGIVAVGAGEYHSLALRKDSTIWSWGNNSNGQLGNGSLINRSLPVQVLGVTHVAAIAAGQNHSLALKRDSTVWDWGYNAYGQLGDSTLNLVACQCKEQAVKVHKLKKIIAIAGGSFHSLALRSDSTVWAWGSNVDGQLGDSTTTDSPVPVQVHGLTNVIAIAAGGSHSLALKSDSTLWAWGRNTVGQLGDSTINGEIIPIKINALTGIVAIAASITHSMALKSDSAVYCWGYNYYNQLGDGTLLDAHFPIHTPYVAHVTNIAAGGSHSIALLNDYSMFGWGNNYYGIGNGTTNTVGCECVMNAEPVIAFCSKLSVPNLMADDNFITIAPNPFADKTTITFSSESNTSKYTLYIRDVLGNNIIQSTINSNQYTIDMSNVAKGVYFVEVIDNSTSSLKEKKKNYYRKIVVQ